MKQENQLQTDQRQLVENDKLHDYLREHEMRSLIQRTQVVTEKVNELNQLRVLLREEAELYGDDYERSRNSSTPVSYTHLTLPTNREV